MEFIEEESTSSVIGRPISIQLSVDSGFSLS